MNMTYIDSDGQRKYPIMGCYGIGVGRLLACIIEASHDEYGPIWPMSVAPWQLHICALNNKKDEVRRAAEEIYNKLKDEYEVIMDDRKVAPGVQFADADLLGVPIRIVVGERNIKNGEVEIMTRDKSVKKIIKLEGLEEEVANIYNRLASI